MAKKNKPLPIFIWDAADPLRLRIATRMVRDAADAHLLCPMLPIVGLMGVMGAPAETLKPREEELLFRYIERLLPAFLEVLEGVWGPLNTKTASEVLHLAQERSAIEMAEVEISLEDWFDGTRH